MTTASQRGAANRRRGLTAERDLCRWLRSNGFPQAERAVRTGFRTADRTSADPGDIAGTGLIWSVKDCAVERLPEWLAELDTMDHRATPGPEPLRLLVVKRRGHADPARWWAYLRLLDLTRLLSRTIPGPVAIVWDAPVRLEVGHVVPLLRADGYGDPQEAAS